MTLETAEDLEKLKKIGYIVAKTIKLMKNSIESGMTTKELDDIGRKYLELEGAKSAPELVYNFPGATCISINESVAHGIPNSTIIRDGDMVNIDVSAELDGYFADSGSSFIVPPSNDLKKNLIKATKQALNKAIDEVKAGVFVNIIGKTIEKQARKAGFSIIRDLGSHGVGRHLHEEPKFIAPFYDKNDKRVLKEGMVITIEPFLSTGAEYVFQDRDGWTLKTDKRYITAQFEHTMVITKNKPILITVCD
ncbi:MAG: type I methionyl aminopeptidase [Cyanobacteriota bacterium]|mgnify:CR=1 FL=1